MRGGGGKWKCRSISDGSGISMGLGVVVRVIAGATCIGYSGGVWAATLWAFEFSEKKKQKIVNCLESVQ